MLPPPSTLAAATVVWSLLTPEAAQGESPGFHIIRLDSLRREVPMALAAQPGGAALAIYRDASARSFFPNGRSQDEVLPVHHPVAHLPKLGFAGPQEGFFLSPRPHHMSNVGSSILFAGMPDTMPWNSEARGELVRPWLLRLLMLRPDWRPYAQRYYGKPPPEQPLPFSITGCLGGGLVLVQDGHVNVRYREDDDWTVLSSQAMLPATATVNACERIDDELHAVFVPHEVEGQARNLLELILHEDGGITRVRGNRGKLRYYPDLPPRVQRALRVTSAGRQDLRGCESQDGDRTAVFAWYRRESVVSVFALYQGGWAELSHYPADSKMVCQQGGIGLFVALDRGVELIQPDTEARTGVVGRAPEMLPPRNIQPLKMLHGFAAAFMPHHIQLYAELHSLRGSMTQTLSHGGPTIRLVDAGFPGLHWRLQFYLTWELGWAGRPYDNDSHPYRKMRGLPREMRLTDASHSPVAVYASPLQRRASEEVFAALNGVLLIPELTH